MNRLLKIFDFPAGQWQIRCNMKGGVNAVSEHMGMWESCCAPSCVPGHHYAVLWVANCTIGMSASKPRAPVGGLKMCQIGGVL